MSRDKLIKQISKLLALGDATRNNSEEEALRALQKAKELMVKHNLDMSEVEATTSKEQKPSIIITQGEAHTIRHMYFPKYQKWIGMVVRSLTETEMIYQHNSYRQTSMVFIGDANDVALAKAIFPILLKTVRRFARRHYGSGWKTDHRNYADGFAYRLMQRARDMKIDLTPKQEQQWGLILYNKETAIAKVVGGMNLKMMRNSRQRQNRPDAFVRGHEDGGRVNLNFRNSLNRGEK